MLWKNGADCGIVYLSILKRMVFYVELYNRYILACCGAFLVDGKLV